MIKLESNNNESLAHFWAYIQDCLSGNLLSETDGWAVNSPSLYSHPSFSEERDTASKVEKIRCYLLDKQEEWLKVENLFLKNQYWDTTDSLVKLTLLPEEIGIFKNLRTLDLKENQLETLPSSIQKLQSLCFLNLSGNCFTSFPKVLLSLKNLQQLVLFNNSLKTLPYSIHQMQGLKILDVGSNQLVTLPQSLDKLPQLETINLTNNGTLRLNPHFPYRVLSNNPEILRIQEEINYCSKSALAKLYQSLLKDEKWDVIDMHYSLLTSDEKNSFKKIAEIYNKTITEFLKDKDILFKITTEVIITRFNSFWDESDKVTIYQVAYQLAGHTISKDTLENIYRSSHLGKHQFFSTAALWSQLHIQKTVSLCADAIEQYLNTYSR